MLASGNSLTSIANLKETLYFVIFQGEGSGPLSPPLDPRMKVKVKKTLILSIWLVTPTF